MLPGSAASQKPMTDQDGPPAFFVPGTSDPKAAWDWYVQAVDLKASEAEPLYEISYRHGGDRYEVRVGEPRHCYRRETGPRGGYRRNAGTEPWSTDTGTVVAAIMRAPNVIYVWSLPPDGEWANPSMVGSSELKKAVPFSVELDVLSAFCAVGTPSCGGRYNV